MSEEKQGFMSRLFGRKREESPQDDAPPEERRPDATPNPSVPDGLSPALGRGAEREVHGATAEEDSEAGDTRFLHEERAATKDEHASQVVGEDPPRKKGFFGRLTSGLSKTSRKLTSGIADVFTRKKLDAETLEELEDLLVSADLGVEATGRVIARLRKERVGQDVSGEEVRGILASVITETLEPLEKPLTVDPARKPHVILVVGVNGAGKTTTIGKLASKLTANGHSVLLAAGDTFRAAAIEQLAVWGERAGAPVVTRPHGADAAGLAYEAIEKARAEGRDVVLIDTAGRLQNRTELMDELAKIVRVIKKLDPDAPHDTLLVLDATVGQNAISQARTFTEIAGVTGLVMTKLDGTARGGILVALGDQFGLPIHYIGIGEGIDDLRPFSARDFAEALTTDV